MIYKVSLLKLFQSALSIAAFMLVYSIYRKVYKPPLHSLFIQSGLAGLLLLSCFPFPHFSFRVWKVYYHRTQDLIWLQFSSFLTSSQGASWKLSPIILGELLIPHS